MVSLVYPRKKNVFGWGFFFLVFFLLLLLERILKTSGQALDGIWCSRPCGISLKLLPGSQRSSAVPGPKKKERMRLTELGSWAAYPKSFPRGYLLVLTSDSQSKAHRGLRSKLCKSCCIWPFLGKRRMPPPHKQCKQSWLRATPLPFPQGDQLTVHQHLSLLRGL